MLYKDSGLQVEFLDEYEEFDEDERNQIFENILEQTDLFKQWLPNKIEEIIGDDNFKRATKAFLNSCGMDNIFQGGIGFGDKLRFPKMWHDSKFHIYS